MATSSDDPPGEAIPLSEALVVYVDAQLVEARRVARERFVAVFGFSPDSIQHSLTNQAEQAARSEYYRAGKAIQDCMRELIRTSRLQLWGREASPIGPWCRVPAQASAHVRFVGGDVIKLPGAPQPVTLYDVVAALATAPLVASVVASTVAAEKRCQNWLVSLMAGGTHPGAPKHNYFRKAQERFGVSKRGFDRAWGVAIAETQNTHWRQSGPRSPTRSPDS